MDKQEKALKRAALWVEALQRHLRYGGKVLGICGGFQMLGQQMQSKIIGDVKVTPSEVRDYFAHIPSDSLPYINAELEIGRIVKKPIISKKEKDEASQKRLELIEEEISKLEIEIADMEEIWRAEKAQAQGSQHVREEIDKLRQRIEELTRMPSDVQDALITVLSEKVLPIPELNQERRKELTKVAHQYAEKARVAVRNVRRDGMDLLKRLEKDGLMSEDDHRKKADEVQKMTDDTIKDIEQVLKHKEQEIMQV